MKALKGIMLSLLLIAAAVVAVQAQGTQKDAKTAVVTFDTSIHCQSCKAKIEKHIPFEKGFKDMKIDVDKKTVTITYDTSKTDVQKLQQAIEKLGYTCSVKPVAGGK